MKKPRLAIIGTVGLPAQYGGFETLTEQLVKYIDQDFDITVYCSSSFYKTSERKEKIGNVQLKYIPLNANGIQSIPYDMISIIHAAFKADIFLILGVSGCLLLPFVKFFTRKKAFVNIDGIEWKRDKWNKLIKMFLRYSEIFAVESAEHIITDNQVIKDYLKSSYNYDSHLIEYGGDQASHQRITPQTLATYPFLKNAYAFSVCRIEPENNIHVILEAMAAQNHMDLVFVGNWEKSDYGKSLKNKYNAFAHCHLLDPIYEPILLNQLRSNCQVYLHGHSAGGTNPSIVEAMNLKLPILAYDVMYNRESTENKALYFKDKSDILDHLDLLNQAKKERVANDMFNIAKRRYTWRIIAEKYRSMMMPNHVKKKQTRAMDKA